MLSLDYPAGIISKSHGRQDSCRKSQGFLFYRKTVQKVVLNVPKWAC